MTFKTEKGQLVCQWLLGLKLCLWVGYFGYILLAAAMPVFSEDNGVWFFWQASLVSLAFLPGFISVLSLLNCIQRILLWKITANPYAESYALRNKILAGLYGVGFLVSVSAHILFLTDGWSLYVQCAPAGTVCLLAGIALWRRFAGEEKPAYTVKLYRRKWLVLSLALLLLIPAFIPMYETDRLVYLDGVGCTGRQYYAVAYSVVTRTVEGEVVEWNFALFPFNYRRETHHALDRFWK